MFTTRPEIAGTFGVVASTHWLASQVGMAVLERGGNAFDAAVAAAFTLQVAESSQTVGVSADALSIETAPQANKSLAKSKSVTPPATVFEITTDSGKVFTSADGRAWTEKK